MSTDHIVINYEKEPVVQQCNHCGETALMPMNCSLSYASDVMKVFIKHHRNCKAKPKTS